MKKKRKRPGPKPPTIAIEGDWKGALRTALAKKEPEGGWPPPETKKRPKRK